MNKLSQKAKDFIEKEMSIELNDLFNSIEANENSESIYRFIEDLHSIVDNNKSNDEIFDKFKELTDGCNNQSNFFKTVDAIRHAFLSFSNGGLLDLYIYQEREFWYPKVVLKNIIDPNDIFMLGEVINVYRGCNKLEYENFSYGQSWSTSLDVAFDFAYMHYRFEPWFDKSKRRVVKAKINKRDVFYSKQSVEFEIVLDSTKIFDVELIC